MSVADLRGNIDCRSKLCIYCSGTRQFATPPLHIFKNPSRLQRRFRDSLGMRTKNMTNALTYAQRSLETYCIGTKLRALRTQKRLTLSRLATETGLSTALLSKLETDRMIPTLPTLATICRVYGVGLSYFFNEASRHTLAITRKAHLAGNGRGQEAIKHVSLHAASAGDKLVARMVELPAGVTGMISEAGRAVCAVFYVLEGRLQLGGGG